MMSPCCDCARVDTMPPVVYPRWDSPGFPQSVIHPQPRLPAVAAAPLPSPGPPTVAGMITETPAIRAHQRLGAQPAVGADEPSDSDARCDDETTLSRWLPDSVPSGPGWLAAVRADPGRAGAIALAVVGVVAVLVTVFTVFGDDRPPVAAAKLPPVQMVSSTSDRWPGRRTQGRPGSRGQCCGAGAQTGPGHVARWCAHRRRIDRSRWSPRWSRSGRAERGPPG